MITGIFHQLATNETFEFINNENQEMLDVDYYLSHSGKKFISNLYNNILEYYPNDDPLIKLSKIIENRYKDKWDRVYNALIETEYKPLENYSMLEVETPDLEDHRVTKVDQNITEVETPDLEDHRVTKVDQDVTNVSDDDVYGFNSSNSSPSSKTTNHITGSSDDNQTDETLNRTGTNTRVTSGSSDDNQTDETINHTGTRELTRSGNIGVTTSQQMLESEIRLRALYNMINIIYDDVDKVLCLSIY